MLSRGTVTDAGLNQSAICQCFNDLFAVQYRVRLEGGGCEPDYIPAEYEGAEVGEVSASVAGSARIIAREDFAASALHEAAHWCVAGPRRRALPDYGYAYTPPPRTLAGQAAFFAAELRVQATECYLSKRAGLTFRASADDPDVCLQALARFDRQVRALAASWEHSAEIPRIDGPPQRAVQLGAALAQRWAESQR